MLTETTPVAITEAQRQQLDQDGFFITDVLFNETTLAAVRGEFQRFWDEEIATVTKTGDANQIHWAKVRPLVAQLDRRSEICRAFCHHPVFAELCRQLIGPDADLAWNQVIIKAPMPGGATSNRNNVFGWHQDQYYAVNGKFASEFNMDVLMDPLTEITAWVAISRTTVNNGTLWVLPGRHKEGLLPHVWSDERNEYQGQFDTAWRIPVVLQAGQVLIFRKYLPHSSGMNVSNEVRMAYQLAYSVVGMNRVPSKNFTPMIRNGELV